MKATDEIVPPEKMKPGEWYADGPSRMAEPIFLRFKKKEGKTLFFDKQVDSKGYDVFVYSYSNKAIIFSTLSKFYKTLKD